MRPQPSSASSGTAGTGRTEDARATTLNYEYREQAPVKLNISPSELQFFEDAPSQVGSSIRSTVSSRRSRRDKPDRNADRFFSSLLVLVTLGATGVLLNACFVRDWRRLPLSLVVLFYSMLVYEWFRVHGITLSRRLRPVLKMSSVFATYKKDDPDTALLYSVDKYRFSELACCNAPEINTDLPRTADEKSPPKSPPTGEKDTVETATSEKSTATEKRSSSSKMSKSVSENLKSTSKTSTPVKSSPKEPPINSSTEIKFKCDSESDREY